MWSDRSVIYADMMVEKLAPTAPHTREALLDAGAAVAEEHGLAGMSVNLVVARAGVAKGTFYVHFPDRDAFIDALHERFHARVQTAVTAAIAGIEPGPEQLARGAEAYLDQSLADRSVKALALEARTDPALMPRMAARHDRAAAAAIPSFKAMGWPDAPAAAQLVAAMTAEIAMRELDAGRRLPSARRALRHFLGAL